MKKIYIITVLVLAFLTSCSKDSLKLENPNEPSTETLKNEEVFEKFAIGVYNPMREFELGESDISYPWIVLTNHNLMGDVTVTHAGNFGWRYTNQVASIVLPSGEIITAPEGGGSQSDMLNTLNSREKGDLNVMAQEWVAMYGLIGHCNYALQHLNADDVSFSGTDAQVAVKKKTYKVWFLWWKGFAYSRIGSLYSKAVITDEYGKLQTNYQDHTAIIAEANKIFKEAKDILATITSAADIGVHNSLMKTFVPAHFQVGNGGVVTPEMFVRNINSYMARNLLVNKYADELTTTELNEIKTLAEAGIKEGDKIFTIRSADSDCFVATTGWSPYRMLVGWENISERLIQDFKTGDNRLSRNFTKLDAKDAVFNPSGRGLTYGTTYEVNDGSDYASTTAGQVELPFACTYEENQLMLAEVKIRSNDIQGGLAHIDAVRNYQKAQLAAVANTGLNQTQALEELRSERRVGLFLKGTSFYDARRWKVLKNGRTNANVLVKANGTVEPCTINYGYKEWFDVPANETDFNPIK